MFLQLEKEKVTGARGMGKRNGYDKSGRREGDTVSIADQEGICLQTVSTGVWWGRGQGGGGRGLAPGPAYSPPPSGPALLRLSVPCAAVL